jgi:hypothetical protein
MLLLTFPICPSLLHFRLQYIVGCCMRDLGLITFLPQLPHARVSLSPLDLHLTEQNRFLAFAHDGGLVNSRLHAEQTSQTRSLCM